MLIYFFVLTFRKKKSVFTESVKWADIKCTYNEKYDKTFKFASNYSQVWAGRVRFEIYFLLV
jgi:hypothetical protein